MAAPGTYMQIDEHEYMHVCVWNAHLSIAQQKYVDITSKKKVPKLF